MPAVSLSKTDKLIQRLRQGQRLSPSQIMRYCGFACPNSVYGTISQLRAEGFDIARAKSNRGTTQYYLAS